jgi:hypothetical protein
MSAAPNQPWQPTSECHIACFSVAFGPARLHSALCIQTRLTTTKRWLRQIEKSAIF